MREIIHISAGQCGNQIGSAFWETISKEHGISPDGHRDNPPPGSEESKEKLDVYYAESANRYIPRAVMVDLEPATIDNVRSSEYGKLFRPDNFVNALSSAGNNWAKGYYTEGAEIVPQVMDVIRREAEIADSLQGFQLSHSLGGGTGSGLGTLLINNLREEYNDRMIATYSVFPSSDSDTVVEPYNTVLALNELLEDSNENFCLDNKALYSIFQNTLKVSQPKHQDLNALVAQVMSGVTTSLRYPGQLNSDLRKLAVNLVPFTRLHFFTVGYAPLLAKSSRNFASVTVPEITQQFLDGRCLMAGVNPREGKFLTCGAFFRGKASVKEVEDEMLKYRQRNDNLFVNFIPDNVQTSLCPVPAKTSDIAATFIANTTSITQLLHRVHSQFSKMYRRQAFLHWYINEGMDHSEFVEAESNLNDLINDYEQHNSNDVGVADMMIEGEVEYQPEYEDDGYANENDEVAAMQAA